MCPEAIDVPIGSDSFRSRFGKHYAIHYAVFNRGRIDIVNQDEAIKIIQFLLLRDSGGVRKTVTVRDGDGAIGGCLPLHMANYRSDSVEIAKLSFLEAVFARDAQGFLPVDHAERFDASERASFLHTQLECAREVESGGMMEQDDDGKLLLHHALEDQGISLGAIKLMVKANPSATRISDHSGLTPLHIACQSSSVSVVMWLAEFDEDCLCIVDALGDTPLHKACRRGERDIVNNLLEKSITAISVQNLRGELPIHALLEAGYANDRPEYTEAIWRLLRAYPECLMEPGQTEEMPSPTPDRSDAISARKCCEALLRFTRILMSSDEYLPVPFW